jgi:hypothetical protein
MRAARILGTALLAGLFVTLPGVAPADGLLGGPPVATAAASPAQEMLTLVNAERSKAGCAPVRLDARLNAAASSTAPTWRRTTNRPTASTGRRSSAAGRAGLRP